MKIDRLLATARVHFQPDEEPLSAVLGFYDARTSSGGGKRKGIIVATNLRMIFYSKKMRGFDLETFSYDDLSWIEAEKTWTGPAVAFVAAERKIVMKWITAGDVHKLVDTVREIIGTDAPSTDAQRKRTDAPGSASGSAMPDDEGPRPGLPGDRAPRLETVILRAAAANGGSITPAAIAADGEYSLEECKEHLQTLVDKGHAELKSRDSGAVFYAFPDLTSMAATERPATNPPGRNGANRDPGVCASFPRIRRDCSRRLP